MEIFILPLILVALLIIPVLLVIVKFDSVKKKKIALISNICSFFAVLVLAAILPIGNFVGASDEQAAEESSVSVTASAEGMGYLAAALATGIGSIGCGIAVSSAASAAIGATAEEPKVFSKALIFVALGEGVALYGFLISFMILQKL
ncbi:MAG: ATPase [Oscillospiraceae bacterium]|nr:ATPase [Oscillospiraceae bacterium]